MALQRINLTGAYVERNVGVSSYVMMPNRTQHSRYLPRFGTGEKDTYWSENAVHPSTVNLTYNTHR